MAKANYANAREQFLRGVLLPIERHDHFDGQVNRGSLLALMRECAADDTLAAPELAPQAAINEANICVLVTRVATYERAA